MRRRLSRSLRWGTLVFLLAAGSAGAVTKPCVYCHVSDRPESSDVSGPATELCLDCHPDRSGNGEHPTGSVPTFTGEVSLPLGQGRIVCTTCHDPHTSANGMLRLPVSELCPVCHVK